MRSSSTDVPADGPPDGPRSPLASAAEQHGGACHVAANRPISITHVDCWWYVAEGTVDLFAVPLSDDKAPDGRRTHLMTCRSGDVLFGIDAVAATSFGLLIVGRMSARVLAAPIAVLEESTEVRPELANALHFWIGQLSEVAARMVVPRPAIDTRMAPDEDLPVGRRRRIAGATGDLVWLSGLAGATFLDVTGVGAAKPRSRFTPRPGSVLPRASRCCRARARIPS